MSRLLITPGEPAGIGPDIVLRLAEKPLDATIVVVADPELLEQRAEHLGLKVNFNIIDDIANCTQHQLNTLDVLPVPLVTDSEAGKLNPDNSAYVLECLKLATHHCLQGNADALVTGPVHKGNINNAGFGFTGHTEYLAELSNSQPVMMLTTKSLRVALVTTHLALREVSDAISTDSVEYAITTLNDYLKHRCDISRPELIVLGLNPHAGEDGHLGMEEIEIISPVIEQCRNRGINILGPLPADTAFTGKYLDQADAVLAMYHDQGLPVLKYSGFGEAVNVTLGLPFLRTSVDHGTALELAGTGKANETSLLAAIELASQLHYN